MPPALLVRDLAALIWEVHVCQMANMYQSVMLVVLLDGLSGTYTSSYVCDVVMVESVQEQPEPRPALGISDK